MLDLNNDDKKMRELLYGRLDEQSKTDIILTMESDEKKIEAMKRYIKDSKYRYLIIDSLYLDENKINCLELLNEKYQEIFINNFRIKNDEQLIKIIVSLKSDLHFYSYTKKLTEENKIRVIGILNNDFRKANIIRTLSTDRLKIEMLENLTNENAKAMAIASFVSDELKIEQLDKLNNEDAMKTVVISILDKNKRMEQLDKLKNENYKADIIVSLTTDEEKIKQMNRLKDETAKAIVIESMSNDDIKIEQLDKLKNELAKARVILSLSNREKRKEKINEIKDTFLRFCMLGEKDELLWYYLLISDKKYDAIGLDKNITIGMEIESEGVLSKLILSLYKSTTEENEYESWLAKTDHTLYSGVEIVSPKLIDDELDVENVYIICSMLKKLRTTNYRKMWWTYPYRSKLFKE